MRQLLAALIGLAALAHVQVAPAPAAEQILLFDSSIEVGRDGSLLVHEEITVRAEGADIRRGIYRDLPTRYHERAGLFRYVGIELLDVRRDGRPEPHFTERHGDYLRIYAGEASVFLRPGEYTYTFRYRTTRQLGFFADFDEVYWNVTGNLWQFPIRKAVGRVSLPEGARITRQAAYTGGFGTAGGDYRVTFESDRAIGFETTRMLQPGEGLTIAVGFPKGIVAEPGGIDRLGQRLWDNLGLVLLVVAAVAVAAYYLTTWNRVGRDPRQGVIIPLFAPPAGLSPAAVSYVHYQGFASAAGGALRAFIAALVSLAVKRRIRIADDDGTIVLERAQEADGALPAGEAAILSNLLGGRDRFAFEKKNGTTVANAQTKFRSAILKEHEGVFFRNNYGYFALGAAMSLAGIVAFLLLAWPGEEQMVLLFVVLAATLAGSLLLSMGSRRILGWLPGGGSVVLGVLLLVIGTAAMLAVVAPLFAIESNLLLTLPAVAFIAIGVLNVAFFHLLRAPTIVGRKVMDDIEGFRLYLSVAEADWMNMKDAPDMSEQVFEAYLPYAVALGVEKPWSEAFERHLRRVMPDREPGSTYRPDWYRGTWSSGSLGRATSGMVSSMASGMAAAMPSRSGSGSGGGGFSGGGGGGGGGGGW